MKIRIELFEQIVVGGHRDHRHVRIDQRERAMLEFAGGIGLGVDVGDLFQFERAFHGDGILRTPAEEQGVVLVGEILGELLDLAVERERLLDPARNGDELFHEIGFGRGREVMTATEHDHQHEQRYQLGSEGLGGRDADFGPGARHEREVGRAYQRTLGHVADGERSAEAAQLRFLQRGERVGGLARLGNRHHQRIAAHHRPAITEFARDLDAARYARERFEPVARDLCGMEAGAAGDDVHALHLVEYFLGTEPESGFQYAVAAQAACERLGQRTRLLENFFEHVVAILATLDGVVGEFADLERPFHRRPSGVINGEAVAPDLGDVAVLEKDETQGNGDKGSNVGGDEMFTNADAAHQLAAAPRRQQHPGIGVADHAQRVGAVQSADRGLDSGEQALPSREVIMNLVHYHFGVGLGGELITGPALHGPQRLVNIDDAVVHHGHGVAANVRMGVGLGGLAVGGPAGVGDAAAAVEALLAGERFDLAHLAGRAHPIEGIVVIQHHYAGGIVTAVFEPLQAFDQNGNHVALRDRANYTAHIEYPRRSTNRFSAKNYGTSVCALILRHGYQTSDRPPPAVLFVRGGKIGMIGSYC